MEPIIEHTIQPNIEVLQQDLKIISQDFANHIKTIARDQLQKLATPPANHQAFNFSTDIKLA